MSYVRIWIHLVFTTKKRSSFLNDKIRGKVKKHIIENCKKKDIFLQAINGYTDHLHCLLSLGKDQSITEVTQLIKGESSFWINKNKLTELRFSWQDDYYAVSVSESQVNKVVNYIKNQEEHHKKRPLEEELKEFVEKYGFKVMSNE